MSFILSAAEGQSQTDEGLGSWWMERNTPKSEDGETELDIKCKQEDRSSRPLWPSTFLTPVLGVRDTQRLTGQSSRMDSEIQVQ